MRPSALKIFTANTHSCNCKSSLTWQHLCVVWSGKQLFCYSVCRWHCTWCSGYL